MKYSVFTVCMPEYQTERVPGLLAKWGFDGVEWRVTNQEASEKPGFWKGNRTTILESEALAKAPEVKSLCKEAGVEIIGLGTYVNSNDLKRIPPLMEAARVMGTRGIRVSTPYFDGSKSYNMMWKEAKKNFAKIERMVEKYGVRANVEMHMNTLTPSASAALRFLGDFNPKHMGVIYDVGNQVKEGGERYRAGLEMLGKYLSHVHMKNAQWVKKSKEADGTVKWSEKWATLKGGIMDLGALYEVLAVLKYDGWISIEDFSPGNSQRKLTEGLAYLKKLEARAKQK